MTEMEFALNTFYLVLSGAFVMWMAAGFTMLEAGLVRSKNVSEIVTKNLGLYSIACVMYLACGFYLMYPGDDVINAYLPGMGTTWGISLAGLTANYDWVIPMLLTSFSRLFSLLLQCQLSLEL